MNDDATAGCDVDAPHHGSAPQSQEAWDESYRERPQLWTGAPNVALVAEVSDLPPGTALDAGAGEGGDALWLAGRGWRVTGVELSAVALERAKRAGAETGLDVEWRHLDLTQEAVPGEYDLVTACYLHVPGAAQRALFAQLADAVASGGTLLIVGHEPHDMPRPELVDFAWTAEQAAAALDDGWVIDTCTTRPRPFTDREGRATSVSDAILRAHRST